MQRNGKKVVFFLLLAVLTAAFVFGDAGSCAFAEKSSDQSRIEDAGEKKSVLEQEKEKTQTVLDNLKNLKSDTSAYIQKIDENLDEINSEIDSLNTGITGKEQEIADADRELQSAEQVSAGQYEDMKLRIKYMYEKGNTGYLDLLFSSANLNEFLNRAEYVKKITEYDRNELTSYENTCSDINAKKEKLVSEKADLEKLKEEANAKQDSAQTLMSEKKKELSGYETKIGSAETDLAEYNKQIKAQEDEIKAIEAEVKRKEEAAIKAAKEAAEAASRAAAEAGKTPSKGSIQVAEKSLGDIRFIWPCPSGSTITSAFGSREAPLEGASTSHMGIDISAPTGSKIIAAADGEVVVSTYSPSAGNYVMLSHGGGTFSLYMHCSALNVSEGQSVKQGQTIGLVGSTGYSTGPHLHFAIRSGGQYLNPSNYVSP